MMVFGYILITYIGLGLMTVLLVFLIEMFGALQGRLIPTPKEEVSSITAKRVLMMVFTWPPFAVLLYRAACNHQTPWEYVHTRRKQIQDTIDLLKRKRDEAKRRYEEGLKTARQHRRVFWVKARAGFFRVYAYPGIGAIATHFVISLPNGIYVLSRLNSTSTKLLPLATVKTQEEVKSVCDKDTLWNDLCVPTNEKEWNRMFDKLRAKDGYPTTGMKNLFPKPK